MRNQLIVAIILFVFGAFTCGQKPTFEIDYDLDVFMMNGKYFQYISGSLHYFRSIPGTWRHKLQLMKAAGLNAVDV